MPRFIVTMGREEVETFNLAQDRTLIGRSKKADIRLDNPMVSRRHAELRRLGSDYMIINLTGKNGVFVNGKWVDTSPLRDGDNVDLGKYSIRFEYPADEAAKQAAIERGEAGAGLKISTTEMLARIEGKGQDEAPPAPDGALSETADASTFMLAPDELAKVRKTMDVVKGAHLKVHTNPPQMIDLAGDRTTIGKGVDCTLKLDTGWLAPKLSAAVARRGKEFLLEVAGGNVKVNGEKVKGTTILGDGDTIEVEDVKIHFHEEMKK